MPAQVTGFTTFPQRTQPATFSADMDTHIAELGGFVTELNTVAVEVNTNATTASQSAVAAQASAGTAAAIANSVKWVSGTTYAKDIAVWSPANLQTYRRKVAGAGTTDPSNDPTNWQQLYPGLDASCALNYGISGNPIFRMRWGGSTETNWKTICTVTILPGTSGDAGAVFEAEVIESWHSSTGPYYNRYRFAAVVCRSTAGNDLDQNNALVSGTVSGKFLRVVKTAGDATSSIYELQVRQEVNWRRMEVLARLLSSGGNVSAASWATAVADGATVGDIYTPTVSTQSFDGGVKVGNSEITDATTLDWYEEGSYTGTATGLTTAPTGTINFVRIGKQITLQIPASFTGTSNATTFSITGMPTNLRPTASRYIWARISDNGGAVTLANATVGINGTITLYKDFAAGLFTASGTKSLNPQDNVAYLI